MRTYENMLILLIYILIFTASMLNKDTPKIQIIMEIHGFVPLDMIYNHGVGGVVLGTTVFPEMILATKHAERWNFPDLQWEISSDLMEVR